MSRVSTRRARRMMKQRGMKMDELNDIEQVIFKGRNREIVIEGPVVSHINMQGQSMYQVIGGEVNEKSLSKELEVPEEDILLVAQQTGVSIERAKAALEDTEGDLARAILLLTTG